jgi:hypothetical protein
MLPSHGEMVVWKQGQGNVEEMPVAGWLGQD